MKNEQTIVQRAIQLRAHIEDLVRVHDEIGNQLEYNEDEQLVQHYDCLSSSIYLKQGQLQMLEWVIENED